MFWCFVVITVLTICLALSIISGLRYQNANDQLNADIDELETANEEYENFFLALRSRTKQMLDNIRRIDTLGAFESDDETGFVFVELKQVIIDINAFLSIDESLENDMEQLDNDVEIAMKRRFDKRFRGNQSE